MNTTTDWQSERTMTATQYKRILKELGINIAQAGRYLGRSERTSHRYIRGQAKIPVAEGLLLRALVAMAQPPVVPEWRSDRKRG